MILLHPQILFRHHQCHQQSKHLNILCPIHRLDQHQITTSMGNTVHLLPTIRLQDQVEVIQTIKGRLKHRIQSILTKISHNMQGLHNMGNIPKQGSNSQLLHHLKNEECHEL